MDIAIHEDADGWSRSGSEQEQVPLPVSIVKYEKEKPVYDPVAWGFRQFQKK